MNIHIENIKDSRPNCSDNPPKTRSWRGLGPSGRLFVAKMASRAICYRMLIDLERFFVDLLRRKIHQEGNKKMICTSVT